MDSLKRAVPAYDALLEQEFEDPERRVARNMLALRMMLRSASVNVPYYRRLFSQIGADPNDPNVSNVFPKLPILRKHDVRGNESMFHAERLPEGEKVSSEKQSTGTTVSVPGRGVISGAFGGGFSAADEGGAGVVTAVGG